MNLRQSKEFAKFMELSSWLVEKADNGYIYLRKLPLLPPLIMKSQHPAPPIPFVQIEKLARKYKPLQIQIQPLKIEPGFKKYGYKLSGSSGHVTKTLQINLTLPEKKILTQMKKDARYGIRKAREEAVKIIEVEKLASFHKVWKKSVGWHQYVPSLKTLQNIKKAFGKKALFLAATFKREVVAGTTILIAHDQAYYYYAFTAKEGRRWSAQYLLVWQAIRLAKEQGCRLFDFEGVYDKRFPIKSWQGFSHFKKSFGGGEIEFPGSFSKYRLPF